MCPAAADALSGEPEAEVIVLAVGIEHVLDDLGVAAAAYARDDVGTLLLRLEAVAVAEFEEAQVGVAVADVTRYALQSAEEQCLPQDVEVLAEGVEEADQFLTLVGLESVVVCAALQAVVQYLAEAASHELFGYDVLQLVAHVVDALDGETVLQRSGYLHVVVTIDAQDVLHDVAGALHIYAVSGHGEFHSLGALALDGHLQAGEDALDGLDGNVLTDEGVNIVVA